MPRRKKNEIRTVVLVVIALIVFLLIRRERHFTYHPSLPGFVVATRTADQYESMLQIMNLLSWP